MKSYQKSYIIYGKHAVCAALNNPRREIIEIFSTKENLEYLKKIAGSRKITTVDRQHIQSLVPDNAPTQNIAARVKPIMDYHISDAILSNPNSKLVILDKITDPQNLGAILRSAAAFGISALIYAKDGGACESGLVAKAASGALDIVELVEVVNLSQTIAELKKHGFWVVGLDGHTQSTIYQNKKIFEGKVALVIGSEGDGIRPLVKQNCDLLVKIPMTSQIESLNASNAAAIVFYEVTRL